MGAGGAWYFDVNNDSGNGDVTVPDGSFESPVVSNYQADPAATGTNWTFIGTAGIVANGSSLGNAAAVAGSQAAYLSGTGSFSQTVNFSGGYSDISFSAALGSSGSQSIEVFYGTTQIGGINSTTFTPNSSSYLSNITLPFNAAAGTATITFVGTGGGTAFIDNVQVQTVNAMYNSGVQSITSLVSDETAWAAAYGLQMVSYEGGFHVGGDSPTPLQTIANLDPRAQAAEAAGTATYFQDGGELAMYYDTTNLSYELTGDLDNLNTPKLLAIYAALAAGLPSPTVGTALPSVSGQSVTISETNNTIYQTISATNAQNLLVQVSTPGIYSVTFQGSQAAAGTVERVMVDGSEVATPITLPISQGTSTTATFTITTPGLHGIALLSDGTSNVFVNGNAVVTMVSTIPTLASTTSLSTSVASAAYGQSVTLTATVAPATPGAGTPTGIVTFKDGAATLGTGTLAVVNGVVQATLTTSSLAVATHSLTAVYSGDGNFITSTSSTLSQPVVLAGTTIGLSASASATTYGQPITFTATINVVSPGVGTPTGNILFYDGATLLGTGTRSVVGGGVQATFTTSTLAAGPHSITAAYGGDTNFSGNTSAALTPAIGQSATTVTVTSSLNPAGISQAVTLTATVAPVSPGAGTPTGTVNFMDGATLLGSGTLSVVNGVVQATYTTGSLALGTHAITAVYSGDTNFQVNTSVVFAQTVINASVTLINFEGLPVTGAALAEPFVQNGYAFTSSGTSAGSSLTIQGSAATPWPGNWPSNVLMAAYWGSVINIGKSGGGLFNLNSLDLDSNGQAASAVITGYSASGSVLQQQIINLSVTNGNYATVTATLGWIGVSKVSVSWWQNSGGTGGTRFGAIDNLRVSSGAVAATTTSIAASATSAVAGQPITFTATVTPATSGVPSGTVTFLDGATVLGTGTLSVVNGVDKATLSIGLTAGTHSITAFYGGDGSFTGSSSLVVSPIVTTASTTSTVTSSLNPDGFGQTVTFTATVAAVSPGAGTPTGNVTFMDGTTVLGQGALSVVGGVDQATFVFSSLAVGSHSITAVYGGDSNFSGVTSAPLSQSVGPAGSAVSVVTFEGLPITGGTVAEPLVLSGFAFTSSGTSGGNALMVQGTGSSPWPGNWPSTVLMSAYWGSVNNITKSGGGIFNLTSLDLDSNGQAASAVITGYNAAGAVLQQQIVNFSVANGNYATVTATLGWTSVSKVTVSWWQNSGGSGGSRFGAIDNLHLSTGAVAVATTTVVSSAASAVTGQPVTFTAVVSPVLTGTPTGIVTFMDGSTTLGTGTLSVMGGVATATFTTSTLAQGSHTITGVYSGDGTFTSSTSATLAQAVAPALTTTSVTSSISPAVYGQPVTLTAKLGVVAPGAGTPTGSISFYDGNTLLGIGMRSVVGGVVQTTLTTSGLAIGSHSITASYVGDINFIGGTSTALSQSITPAASAISVASNVSAPALGQPVTLTATVTASAPGTGTPTGIVNFMDGTTLLGSGTLGVVSGVNQATLTTSGLALGSNAITAVYSGDTNFSSNSSTVLNQTIAQAASTVGVASSISPAVVGQAVTFTATVSPLVAAAGTPTGTVTFKDGGTVLGTGTLAVVSGVDQATLTTSALAMGSHSITAVYGGDNNFTGSTATAIAQSIGQAASTASVASSLTPTVFGQSVTLTATIAALAPGAGTPTGTVTFKDGGTLLGTGSLAVVSGVDQATLTTSSLALGSHSITAVYGGDTNFSGSTASAISQSVSQASTTVSVTSATSPAVYGQSVTLTATIGVVGPAAGAPTGNVNFYDGATLLGTGTRSVVGGVVQATFTTSSLAIGGHSITASYIGDTNFSGNTSSPITQTINQAAAATSVTSSAASPSLGQPITFTATVTATAPGAGTPTGSVNFMDGSTLLGSGTLGVVSGVMQATLTTSSLATGSHSITAVYSGDTNFAGGTSTTLSQSVGLAASTASVASSLSPAVFGQSVTFTATVGAVIATNGTPTGTVTFEDGTMVLGTGTLAVVNGVDQATFSTINLATLSHSITAVYGGDTVFSGNTSTAITQVVSQASSTANVASTANPAVFGQSVTLTATIAAVAPGVGTPTGSVTFKDGGTVLGTGTLSVVGGRDQATLTTTALALGSHSITAVYGGDSNFTGITSTASPLSITQASTAISVSTLATPTVYGQSVTFTAALGAVSPGGGTPTGNINFYDGSTLLGSGTPQGAGLVTFTTSNLAIGSHSITASYVGDTNFFGSTSSPITQTVNQAATSSSVTSSASAPGFGQSITLTATVAATAPGAGTPTGSVNFMDGATLLGSGTLSVVGGVDRATLTTSSLTIGSHSITVAYSGDSNFAGSNSAALNQAIGQPASTASVASSISPAVVGQAVTFTATVSPLVAAAGTPTGTVTFKDGGTVLGTGTLAVVSGVDQATLTTSALAMGSHSITAVYGGDNNFTGSTATAIAQSIGQAASTASVASSLTPTVFGQSVTLTATIAALAPGAGTPTGTVTFKDGGTLLGTGSLAVVSGVDQATLTTSSLALGSHSITAVYGGDTNFSGSTASAISQSVSQASTTVSVTSATSPAVYGQSVTLTATIGVVGPAAGAPTGNVNFYDGATLLGTGTRSVVGGVVQATFTTSSLAIGGHSITASYIGDTNFSGNTSSPITQTINQAAAATSVTSSAASPSLGQPITFTATVTATAPGAGTPTGSVNFMDGSTLLGSGTLGVVSGVMQATLTTSSLATGSHSITAVYSGDTNFAGGTSTTLSQTVGQPPSTTVVVSSVSPAVVGQSVTLTAAVAAVVPAAGTPTGTVTFKDGITVLGPGTLAVVGGVDQATLTISSLALGSHTITAVYGGDTSFIGSTSASITQVINQAASTASVAPSVASPVVGQSVTLTATVAAASPGSGTPTGSVTFKDGITILGTGTLSIVGGVVQATLVTSSLAVGGHSITVVYGGDSNFTGITSTALPLTILQASTTVGVTSNLGSATYGQPVTFTAKIGVASPGAGTPTGNINFYDGSTLLGTGTRTVTAGIVQATFTTSSLAPASHSITATYVGDANFSGNTSSATTQAIAQAGTTSSVTSSLSAPTFGQAITFTATIAPVAPGAGTPTGTVNFMDGSTLLGSSTLSVVSGAVQATLTTSSLAVASHSITAVYVGDTNFTGSTSTALSQTVLPASTPVTQITFEGLPVTGATLAEPFVQNGYSFTSTGTSAGEFADHPGHGQLPLARQLAVDRAHGGLLGQCHQYRQERRRYIQSHRARSRFQRPGGQRRGHGLQCRGRRAATADRQFFGRQRQLCHGDRHPGLDRHQQGKRQLVAEYRRHRRNAIRRHRQPEAQHRGRVQFQHQHHRERVVGRGGATNHVHGHRHPGRRRHAQRHRDFHGRREHAGHRHAERGGRTGSSYVNYGTDRGQPLDHGGIRWRRQLYRQRILGTVSHGLQGLDRDDRCFEPQSGWIRPADHAHRHGRRDKPGGRHAHGHRQLHGRQHARGFWHAQRGGRSRSSDIADQQPGRGQPLDHCRLRGRYELCG